MKIKIDVRPQNSLDHKSGCLRRRDTSLCSPSGQATGKRETYWITDGKNNAHIQS